MSNSGTATDAEGKAPVSPPQSADTVVIGSGLAGGICAERLVAAGRDCVMLEAGRHWRTEAFPLPEVAQGQLFWRQGVEPTTDGRMIVLRGKCVGGSSVVHQALLDLPPEPSLETWGALSGVGWISDGTLKSVAEAELRNGGFSHRVITADENNRNAQIFCQGMQAEGYRTRQLRRAEADCGRSDGFNCIDCLGGCPRRSKQSALVTSLARALAKGLRIISQTEVRRVGETAHGVEIHWRQGHKTGVLRANRVLLAAGAIGTTAILLRSGLSEVSQRLGLGFCIHPQFNSFARFAEPVDAYLGAFQSVASDDPRLRERGFKLECVALPRAVMSMAMPRAGQAAARLEDYRYWAGAEVSIRDASPGRIVLRRGEPRLEKRLDATEHARRDEARALIGRVFEAVGAQETVHGWAGISVHPMGGAGLGSDPTRGVTAPDFRVHGTKRIFVGCSSLFPDALGANPSLTVMAIARIASEALEAAP